MPETVFTPMNEQRTERLRFNASDIKVLRGHIAQRGYGYQATVEINGRVYNVYGIGCGLSDCVCDAYIKEVK